MLQSQPTNKDLTWRRVDWKINGAGSRYTKEKKEIMIKYPLDVVSIYLLHQEYQDYLIVAVITVWKSGYFGAILTADLWLTVIVFKTDQRQPRT